VAAAYLEAAASVQADLEHETDDGKKAAMQARIDTLTECAKKLRNIGRINNVLTLAQELLGIKGSEWDSDPWLLGVANGVIDLRTGKLRNGRAADYIRTVAPTAWKGLDAPCPRWERFVSEVLSDEADRVTFLQRLLGYGLNGTTSEHVLGICVGERGRYGKRVLFEALQHVLGDYASAGSTDVLIGQHFGRTAGSAQPHLMGLQGKRVIYCSETEEHDKLSTAQVKNITGGDPITARWLNANPVTFMPTHTLFLQTNRKPQAPADDDALWERVKVIEFKVRFVDEPKAPDEHRAIRNWRQPCAPKPRVSWPGWCGAASTGCGVASRPRPASSWRAIPTAKKRVSSRSSLPPARKPSYSQPKAARSTPRMKAGAKRTSCASSRRCGLGSNSNSDMRRGERTADAPATTGSASKRPSLRLRQPTTLQNPSEI
jgi:P4 family phage/plasmid primase-like protien